VKEEEEELEFESIPLRGNEKANICYVLSIKVLLTTLSSEKNKYMRIDENMRLFSLPESFRENQVFSVCY
jgi:hypothetical protein